VAKHHKRLLVGIAVGIAVSAVTIGNSAINGRTSNAGSETTDKVRIVDDRKLPGQSAINAAYGRGALSNLRAALTQIADDNVEEAKKSVTVTQSLLTKIKAESLRPADAADFILIHSEVRVLADADPSRSVQEKLDSIRRQFAMTDHEAIIAALDSLSLPLAYTRVDLPFTKTVTLVNEVLQALNSQDADRARDKLMEIGNGLRIETVHVGTEDTAVDAGSEDDAG
jgi:hypothetical protein